MTPEAERFNGWGSNARFCSSSRCIRNNWSNHSRYILMANSSYTTTESGGRQNMFPSETRPYIDESVAYEGYPQNAGEG